MTVLNRQNVLNIVIDGISEIFDIPAEEISEATRFKEDLDANSIDLIELLTGLENSLGIRVGNEEAKKIITVGMAVDLVIKNI